jgi:glucose-6-phosphate 1-dehydrogenase
VCPGRAHGEGDLTATTVQAQPENPLVEGLERLPVPNTTLTIFGATGDLARRKLLPGLYNLAHEGVLPEYFNLIGIARREESDDEFRDFARAAIVEFSRRTPDEQLLDGLLSRLRYVGFSFEDEAGYPKLRRVIEELDEDAGRTLNRLYYLSTAPEYFGVIVERLGHAGLNHHEHCDVRVIIEKPFGSDLASALALQETVSSVFRERQVFRIDHYLGKETVQNVMTFRFANYLFEPVWNRNYIDHIEITAAEDIGIGSRAAYYDRAGALRDLVENHMLQLLTLVCMEPPARFEANKVRKENVKVLQAITPPGPAQVARKVTEIVVQLKPVPHLTFASEGSVGVQPNQLVLHVQPNEGVSVSLGAKIPGPLMRIRPVNMEFQYGTSFLSESPEAYERLILDAMRGDATLFTRNDETLAQWAIVEPILESWAEGGEPPLETYKAGSSGPAAADALMGEGRRWRTL